VDVFDDTIPLRSSGGRVGRDRFVAGGATIWRRLSVAFPDTIATHSKHQDFYFDEAGPLQRHNYDVDIAGGSPAAHYAYEHQVVQGIVVPIKHRVYIRQPDNNQLAEPLVVSVDLENIQFS
jgi:hypothetical protein